MEDEVVETTESAPVVDDAAVAEQTTDDLVVQASEDKNETPDPSARYKQAFNGFTPDEEEAFLDAVSLIGTDPKTAHEVFAGLVDELAKMAGISKADAKELVEEAVETVEDNDKPLTAAQLDRLLEEREAKKAEESERIAKESAAKQFVDNKIEELGYKPGTPEFQTLLFFANQQEEGSVAEKLEAAAAKEKEYKQSVIDAYLADQDKSNDEHIPVSQGDSHSEQQDKPKDSREAAKRARAFLNSRYGNQQ